MTQQHDARAWLTKIGWRVDCPICGGTYCASADAAEWVAAQHRSGGPGVPRVFEYAPLPGLPVNDNDEAL